MSADGEKLLSIGEILETKFDSTKLIVFAKEMSSFSDDLPKPFSVRH